LVGDQSQGDDTDSACFLKVNNEADAAQIDVLNIIRYANLDSRTQMGMFNHILWQLKKIIEQQK